MTLIQIQQALQRRVGKRDQLTQQTEGLTKKIEVLTQDQKELQRALDIIQLNAKLTQQQLEIHIGELVTLALEAVFPRPYKFVLKFELRRNRTEADLLLEDENGNCIKPMDAAGGGVVDVASFALRLALWSLVRPKPRAVMILDEPFRFLSRDLQPRAGAMVKEMSRKLGIQFLIITHEDDLVKTADKTFRVSKINGRSTITLEAELESHPPQ